MQRFHLYAVIFLREQRRESISLIFLSERAPKLHQRQSHNSLLPEIKY